jgi:hypothetical protein
VLSEGLFKQGGFGWRMWGTTDVGAFQTVCFYASGQKSQELKGENMYLWKQSVGRFQPSFQLFQSWSRLKRCPRA